MRSGRLRPGLGAPLASQLTEVTSRVAEDSRVAIDRVVGRSEHEPPLGIDVDREDHAGNEAGSLQGFDGKCYLVLPAYPCRPSTSSTSLYCFHPEVKVTLRAGRGQGDRDEGLRVERSAAGAKVPVEPVERAPECVDAVLGHTEAVPLAGIHVVLVRLSAVAQRLHNLLRLVARNAGVVLALEDEKRRVDL